MTTLYLIRHAEAEGNVFRRLHGQYNSMITPNGQKQIAALEERFRDVDIDAVYSSDLFRTCRTAEAIYLPKGLPLHKEPRLRELNCGIWEDLPFGWLAIFDRERNRAFSYDPQNWGVEGSETFPIYTGRFLEAMEEIACRHEGQTVAIFSHGMVMRGILQRLFFPEEKDLGHAENTAVTKLIYEKGNYRLEYLNDAGHISYEISTLGKQMWWRNGDKKDHNMWYRDAEANDVPWLREITPEESGLRISMLKDRPTGVLSLKERDENSMELRFFTILPEFRGRKLSEQLLGEAVSLTRRAGKRFLCLPQGDIPSEVAAILAAYGFCDGRLELYT